MNKEQLINRKIEIRNLLSGNEEVNLDELETELRDINDKLDAIERRERLLGEANQINNNEGTETRTLVTFNTDDQKETRSEEQVETEYRKAFMNYVLRGEEIPTELREVSKTTDVGPMIPQTVLNRIVEKLEAAGMILPLVTRTSIKGGITVPVSTVKPTATWVGEGNSSTKQKKTVTGGVTFAYHKLRCAVAVTLETEVTALAVFEATLINNIVEAMTIALEQSIVSGDGDKKPKGILTETPNEGQTLNIAELNYGSLIDAEAALPLEYENGAVYLMTKKTFMKYQGMVDENGQPIARVSYGIGGQPERSLLGRRVVLCNYLDSFTTAATGSVFAILFNFADYVLNTNYAMTVKKYEDNETDDLVTKAILIADGKVIDKGSLVVLKKAATV